MPVSANLLSDTDRLLRQILAEQPPTIPAVTTARRARRAAYRRFRRRHPGIKRVNRPAMPLVPLSYLEDGRCVTMWRRDVI